MRYIGIVIVLLVSQGLFGQRILSYTWDEEPSRIELSPEEKLEPQVTWKYHKEVEYIITDFGNLIEINLEHKIIRLNNDEGIENNNKVYLPTYNLEDLKVNKARVIYEDGRIRELEKEDIQEVKDKDGNVTVLYYAIKGLEKGVDLEILFLRLANGTLGGERISVQDEYPIKNATYEIKVPQCLKLDFKSYNGLEQVEEKEEDGNNVYYFEFDSLDKLEKEDYSVYQSNVKYFIYKLNKDNCRRTQPIKFENQNKYQYKSVYKPDEKEKTITKFLDKVQVKGLEEEEQVKKIESYIKGNYFAIRNGNKELSDLIKEEKGSGLAIVSLFAKAFEQLEIEHELVLTNSRYNSHFDEEFETNYYLSDYLFYFPKTNQFLDPLDKYGRYPFVEFGYMNNKGLFFKLKEIADVKSLVSKVKEIGTLPAEESYQKSKLEFDLSDFEKVNVKGTWELFGYDAVDIQGAYEGMDQDERDEAVEAYLYSVDEDATYENYKVNQAEADLIGKKPVKIEAELSSKNLLEKAGNNYLFKLGKAIGSQSNLYKKEERTSDIELQYLHTLNRILVFTIPNGYQVSNLEKLETETKDSMGNAGFACNYKLNGSEFTVEVKEWYQQVWYAQKDYQFFRSVVNAAADFNKVTLILEPLD